MKGKSFFSVELIFEKKEELWYLWRFLRELKYVWRYCFLIIPVMIASAFAPMLAMGSVGYYLKNATVKIDFLFIYQEFSISLFSLVFIIVGTIFFRVFSWMVYELPGFWSLKYLHAHMVEGLNHVKTTWFDENPSGRVINRLVKDYDDVRLTGVMTTGDISQIILEFSSFILLSLFTAGMVGWLAVPLIVLFLYCQIYFFKALGHAQEMLSASKSKVVSSVTDMIDGSMVIRIYKAESFLKKRIREGLVERAQAGWFETRLEEWGISWMLFYIQLYLGILFAVVLIAASQNWIESTLVAVFLTMLFQMDSLYYWLIYTLRFSTKFLANTRRVFEIVDLPHEEVSERKNKISTQGGGCKGFLEFSHFTMSYREDSPLILKDINISIPLGKRIALIGRTGSGKTTLIQALFRLVYVHEGDIFYDGESIFTPLADTFRQKLGCVPQMPWLFSGTVRQNLDPENEFENEKILELMKLAEVSFDLERVVEEAGKNFSIGERQLICVMRCLLQNKECIILDEPTSSTDPLTDMKVQKLLKEYGKDKTIITIAHRLETIQDAHFLLEVSEGQVFLKERKNE